MYQRPHGEQKNNKDIPKNREKNNNKDVSKNKEKNNNRKIKREREQHRLIYEQVDDDDLISLPFLHRQLNIFGYCCRQSHIIFHSIHVQVAIHVYNPNDHEEICNYHQNHNNLNKLNSTQLKFNLINN